MPTAKLKPKNLYIIVAIVLGLGVIGYVGYRSMIEQPTINKIDPGEGGTIERQGAGRRAPVRIENRGGR